jgi:hypothetical protein
MRKLFLTSLPILALAGALACGGSDNKKPKDGGFATKLTYTNPASATATDYRIVALSGNSTKTVTLELRGPSNVMARGINFGLRCDDPKAGFTTAFGDEYVMPGGHLELGTAPHIFKSVLDGKTVRTSMAQKGPTVAARHLDGPIASFRVQLTSNALKGKIDGFSGLEAVALLENGSMASPVTIKVGELKAE